VVAPLSSRLDRSCAGSSQSRALAGETHAARAGRVHPRPEAEATADPKPCKRCGGIPGAKIDERAAKSRRDRAGRITTPSDPETGGPTNEGSRRPDEARAEMQSRMAKRSSASEALEEKGLRGAWSKSDALTERTRCARSASTTCCSPANARCEDLIVARTTMPKRGGGTGEGGK